MKYRFALTIFLALTSAQALAHSEKESTTPANGAVVEDVPETIGLRFTDGMRLTKVEMIYASSAPKTLEVSSQSGFLKEFSLPLISMGTGIYQIDWRGLGIDGHPMNGTFSFEVK
ncbi:copper resistance CopC family protein [Roseobacter litoralis]|uniref:Copper resistance-like protein n=1 Tax=Roseobacter litoralis (strain ATCC 49566 / DSM 6996 / JCM 21268 / NBRC 15278 / OCh 149) TaxID=391595 RepID=F7ZMH5_ROSLO|nr:copper resistance protein CopC [Roseobacter litoralis]AEI96512.1 copper resistance-like protein [Roseobacter litoralis Och 149]